MSIHTRFGLRSGLEALKLREQVGTAMRGLTWLLLLMSSSTTTRTSRQASCLQMTVLVTRIVRSSSSGGDWSYFVELA